MALPQIKHPLYKLVLPSTGKTISYRPYTVREEKQLLIVRMSEDINEVVAVLKQIVRNCVIDDIDVDKLALFDVEYIFLNIRKVSVSNIIELFYSDGNDKIPFVVDLDQVSVKKNPDHKDTVKITEDIYVKMKYPTIEDAILTEYSIISNPSRADDAIFDMILNSIDVIYDKDTVHRDFTRQELEEFMLSLPSEVLDNFKGYFQTIPVLEHEVEIKLKNGETKKVVLRGLKDFFTF